MFGTQDSGPVLVLAPHPDDETLGAGGTLLRFGKLGRPVHWLIGTQMRAEDGWPTDKMERRVAEIKAVAEAYGFAGVHQLPFPAARLDTIAAGDLVAAVGAVVRDVEPSILLLPHRGDAHSDHTALHDAGAACAKWFRYPSVKSTLVYETLSETDVAIRQAERFEPNVFVDIGDVMEEKLRITGLFGDEIQEFPFPRSLRALTSLAELRGAACGVKAAEGFMLLRSSV